MKFKEPLDLVCPRCKTHTFESVKWLMQEGRCCPVCDESFASLQAPIQAMIQDWTDFCEGADFVVELEMAFGIEISDDDVRRLATAEAVQNFIIDAVRARGVSADRQIVATKIRDAAKKSLGLDAVTSDTDVLARFRRALEPPMTSIRLEHISKTFDRTVALDGIDLSIAGGELFFLLGPSGCGKSTLLRLIAGLYEPTSGRVYFNDRDVTPLGTESRNAVMVFQSYALWPHMTVRENVRFGLQVRRLPRAEQDRRIAEVLDLVQLRELADRKPNQLSGGQQQRVALARSLAVRPDCLLLDEPLSNLDAQLRQQMRSEIRRICKAQGLTTIYVTHDQKEALSVADRIAVMNAGRIAQVGTPAELYHRPNSAFVASFVGETNLLKGQVVARDDGLIRVQTAAGELLAASAPGIPDSVTLSVRPEQMRIVTDGDRAPVNRLCGRVTETTFLGEASEHVLLVNGQQIKLISTPPRFDPPAEMTVGFDPKDAVVLPGN